VDDERLGQRRLRKQVSVGDLVVCVDMAKKDAKGHTCRFIGLVLDKSITVYKIQVVDTGRELYWPMTATYLWEIDVGHQEGPPWKIVGRFPTFEKANLKREKLLEGAELQVKIHYQGSPNNRYFAVKARLDPAIALAEVLAAKRDEKKRRKK